MTDAMFTPEQYQRLHEQQLAIEIEDDRLIAAGIPEGDPRRVDLHRRWLNLACLSG